MGLILWAQSLDNSLPDDIYSHSKFLRPEEIVQRGDAVSSVLRVGESSLPIFDEDGVQIKIASTRFAQLRVSKKQLKRAECEFIIKLISGQTDDCGRLAPIICYGKIDIDSEDVQEDDIVRKFLLFTGEIGRDLQPNHINAVCRGIRILKKNIDSRKPN